MKKLGFGLMRLPLLDANNAGSIDMEIKHPGFSFHDTPELLDHILTKHPEMEFVQLQINYYEVAAKHGKLSEADCHPQVFLAV